MKIYILSCEKPQNGGGIYAYELSQDGLLSPRDYFACDRPMYAVKTIDALKVLLRAPFVTSESGFFTVADDFSSATEIKSTLGVVACHLCADGESVFVVNYLSGNIVKNGEKVAVRAGKSVHPTRQTEPHTHFVGETPDGNLAVCDLGTDTLAFYDKDLNLISESNVPDGYGIRHLAFSKDGKFIYAVNELVPSVSAFSYASGRGTLVNTVRLNNQNPKANGAGIRITDDGKTLFVSYREENAICAYAVDETEITLVSKTDCGGDSPRDINLFGDYLIVTNEKSNNAVVFRINHDLSLTKTDEITLRAPLCCL